MRDKPRHTFNGVFYWRDAADAAAYAAANGFAHGGFADYAPGRLAAYGRGYAIQACPSGPYAGPDLLALTPALQAAAAEGWHALADARRTTADA